MTRPAHDTTAADTALDSLLAELACDDLPPMAAQALLLQSQRRLTLTARPVSRLERCEPAALAMIASAHLLWALLRAFGAASLL